MRGHSAAVSSVCFSSDGKELTSGSYDTTVRNWDLATRASLS
jgi:WD40 repeat protein